MSDMRRQGGTLLRLLLALVVSLGVVASSNNQASAAPLFERVPLKRLAASTKVIPWNPVEKAIYTGPGNKAATNEIKRALRATPSGELVRVTTYAFSDKSMLKEIKKAKKRGVIIQLTSWTKAYRANKAIFKSLRKSLGSYKKTRNKLSYLKLCKKACYGKGTQHTKLVTISRIINKDGKSVGNISFILSANFTNAAVKRTYNHTQLIVGCKPIYTALANYIDGMRIDKIKRNFESETACGYTIHFYPAAKGPNKVVHRLDRVNCIVTKTERTLLRVMMYIWVKGQKKIATKLGKLRRSGCDVGVVVSKGSTHKSIIKTLKKYKVKVYNIQKGKRYLHAKMVVIRGKIGDSRVQEVWSGSANFSVQAIRSNDETQLVMRGAEWVVGAIGFYNKMARPSRRM